MINFDKSQILKPVLILCAILLVLGILEAYTRIQVNAKNKNKVLGFYQNDPYIAQSLKPNSHGILESRKKEEFSVNIDITGQGLRDVRDYEIPKPKNTYRILMLGDSFTLGQGVNINETFSKVIEKSLNSKSQNLNYEVVNAGYASGFTWDEAYLYTKEKGLLFEPDLIIENVWVGNDLTEIGEHEYPELDENNLPKKIISNRTFVTEDGYLRAKNVNKKRRISGSPGILNEKICDSSEFCRTVLRPSIDIIIKNVQHKVKSEKATSIYTEFLKKELNAQVEKNWQTGRQMILALEKIASRSQAKFMVVNIPVKEQVYDPAELLANEDINTTRIEEFAKSENIQYCNILPKLQEKPKEAYFPNDSHLTARGHMLAAEAIEQCIFNVGFLPLESQSTAPFSQEKI